MPAHPPARLDLAQLLRAVEDAPPVAAADVVGDILAHTVGAFNASFLIADLTGAALVRLSRDGTLSSHSRDGETGEHVPIEGTPQGRALMEQTVAVEPADRGWRVVAPVTNRGEPIGVLELSLPDQPGDECLTEVALAAHALAYVVTANRRFTDLFEWGQRSVPLSLAAEIQHRLLPDAFSCEAGQFSVAAWLEPAGEIAGDTFDLALDRETLHLSMSDAMGHATQAALLATVLVGALRNGRRAGLELAEQAGQASAAVAENFHSKEYVTGQVVRIDLPSGTADIVNAGHPPPLRLRRGEVRAVEVLPNLPFGWGEHVYRAQPLALEPGDRLVFVTDGLLERRAARVDLRSVIVQSAGLHPRNAVRHIVDVVVEAAGGALHDDATVMCLDWHGGSPRHRVTEHGADI